jgi:Ni/Fe-hydrogenase subunit HybB-like protein
MPFALGTACYTAFLFAQAKARDLWQSPLLPPHLAVQAAMVGAAVLMPFADGFGPHLALEALEVTVAIASGVHVAFVAGEITLTHSTAHAHLASHEMTHGRFARFFWPALIFVAVGIAAPWIGVVSVPFALVGLLAYEHSYVQAGQSVPLA